MCPSLDDASRLDSQRHAEGRLEGLLIARTPNAAFDPLRALGGRCEGGVKLRAGASE